MNFARSGLLGGERVRENMYGTLHLKHVLQQRSRTLIDSALHFGRGAWFGIPGRAQNSTGPTASHEHPLADDEQRGFAKAFVSSPKCAADRRSFSLLTIRLRFRPHCGSQLDPAVAAPSHCATAPRDISSQLAVRISRRIINVCTI
jgi:hypothetical protein